MTTLALRHVRAHRSAGLFPLLGALTFALVLASAASVPLGHATFPGANGKIAWNAQVEVPPFGEIFVMDADGSNQTNLTNNAAHDSNPQFSPDGTKIAFLSLRDGDSDVYVMNADGTGVTQLTNTGTETPSGWSPDGEKILFSSTRDGNAEIYVMNADGSNQTRLTNNATNEDGAVFSPDGTKIAFTTDRDGNREIYVMKADGSTPTNLTNNPGPDSNGGGPDWSPDGTKIVFNRFLGLEELFVMNADGSNQTNLSNTLGENEQGAAWSPDGTKIAYSRVIPGDPKGNEIFVMSADGSNRTNLTNSFTNDFGADWQPVDVEAGKITCVGKIASKTNSDVKVPRGATCFVDADVNGNFYVEGTLVVLPGRTINGTIELQRTDAVVNIQNSTIKGDILYKEKGTVELSGAQVGNVIVEKATSELQFSNGPSFVGGNLEFKATTNLTGAGNATVNGNAKCDSNVNDSHTGVITVNGNKEGCPAGF